MPPPENDFALPEVILIVAVDADTVVLAMLVFASQLPEQVHVPLPRVIVFVPAPNENVGVVTFLPLASNVQVPICNDRVEPIVRLSASTKEAAAFVPPMITGQSSVLPAVVMVVVPVDRPRRAKFDQIGRAHV